MDFGSEGSSLGHGEDPESVWIHGKECSAWGRDQLTGGKGWLGRHMAGQ